MPPKEQLLTTLFALPGLLAFQLPMSVGNLGYWNDPAVCELQQLRIRQHESEGCDGLHVWALQGRSSRLRRGRSRRAASWAGSSCPPLTRRRVRGTGQDGMRAAKHTSGVFSHLNQRSRAVAQHAHCKDAVGCNFNRGAPPLESVQLPPGWGALCGASFQAGRSAMKGGQTMACGVRRTLQAHGDL